MMGWRAKDMLAIERKNEILSILQKEQRLREFKQELHGGQEVYKKKEKYNRKILE